MTDWIFSNQISMAMRYIPLFLQKHRWRHTVYILDHEHSHLGEIAHMTST